MNKAFLLTALLAAFACGGCSNQKPEPLYASSAVEASYAERYPEELATARGRLSEHESKAQQMMAAFSTYPDELSNPNWKDVETVVDRADQAGKSGAYVARLEEGESVARFFSEERDELDKKVGGAAQYAVKQKNCEVDVYGTTSAALDKAVEKQLEERLRERNEAHRFIEDNEDSLGRPNLEKLQKQADSIAYTSYLTHVGVKQTRERIEALLEEGADVKKTLDRTLEESRVIDADAGRSEGQKQRARARAQAAEAAKQRIDSEMQQAEYVLEQLDDRIDKLQKDYAASLDGLKQRIRVKASATPQT
jgi:hypothetical protein